MLKNLVIPAFILTAFTVVAVGGCGSDTPATTGKAGTGGAGTGAAGTGAAGATAGTGAAGATAGTGAAGATAGTGAAGATAGTGAAGAAAGTGAAGSDGGAAGTGAAGSDGGAAGTGAAGSDGGAAGTGAAGSDGGAAETGAIPACSSTTPGSAALEAAAFCANMVATCAEIAGVPEAYKTVAGCMTAYAGRNADQKKCQSYHLCGNAYMKTPQMKMDHCPHGGGLGPCVTGL